MRTLMQEVLDHGGDIDSFNHLLEDIKGERKLVTSMAILLACPILWQLTEEFADGPIDLGEIDFDCPAETFYRKYPMIFVRRPDKDNQDQYFSSMRPTRPCKYLLVHLGSQKRNFQEVVHADLGANREHASWRELLTYGALLREHFFRNCMIVAAGSHLVLRPSPPHAEVDLQLFPVLAAPLRDVERAMSGPIESENVRTFGPKCFYLVRVYEEPAPSE